MQLNDYLEKQNISRAEFGRQIGKTRDAVSKYCRLERIPEIPLLIQIKQVTDGQVGNFEDWTRDGVEGSEVCQGL
jgi:transcriptional regulator with XRE-family HTH domain